MKLNDYDSGLFSVKRKVLGITSDELASMCRVSRQTVSAIENGRDCNESTKMLMGLVLDILADESGVEDVFEALESSER